MRRVLALLCVLALPGIAHCAANPDEANPDEDVVSLTSGNRLSGRILDFARGRLQFRITGAGTVNINVDNIESIESARSFEIELPSGERVSGTLSPATPGAVSVRGASGETRTVPLKDVIRMLSVGATIRERTTADVELGFDFLSGGDATNLTFSGEVENRTRNYLTEISLDSLLNRLDDETTQRRNDFEIATRRFLPNRLFVLADLGISEDLKLGLDSRYLVAGALGIYLSQSSRTTVAVYGGLDYILEDYQGVPGNNSSVEALATLEWDWFEPGGDTEVDTSATVYRTVDQDRWRLELDASLKRDIFRNFYWSVNVFESYDSDPPAGLDDSDFGVTLAVGLSLSRL